MNITRRGFVSTLGAVIAALPAISFGGKDKLVPVPATGQYTDLMPLTEVQKAVADSYVRCYQHMMYWPNDDMSRRFMLNSVSEPLRSFHSNRDVLDYQLICDETNNPVSVISKGGCNVTALIHEASSRSYLMMLNMDSSGFNVKLEYFNIKMEHTLDYHHVKLEHLS